MPKKPSEQFLPVIRQGKIGEISIHQISDEELNLLTRGGSNSIFLDFAIALLSVAVSFTFSLSTTVIQSDRLFIVFTIITVVGYVVGIVLIVV